MSNNAKSNRGSKAALQAPSSNPNRKGKGRGRGQSRPPGAVNNTRSMATPSQVGPVLPQGISRRSRIKRIEPSDRQLNYNRESTDDAKQFLQCCLPCKINGSVVMPDRGENMMHTAHFTRTVSVDAATIVDGAFKIIMSPDLFQPGAISSAASIVPAVQGACSVTGIGYWSAGVLNSSSVNVVSADQTEKALFAMYNLFGNPLLQGLIVTVPAVGGCRCDYVVKNISSFLGSFTLTFYDAAAVVLATTTRTLVGGFTSTGTVTIPSLTIAVSIVNTSPHNGQGLQFSLALAEATVWSGPTSVFSPAFARQIIDDDVSKGRVVSMSILAHNTTPAISRGGMCNSGRVPYSQSPFSATIAGDIAKLPANRRWQDVASEGAYSFWIPASTKEWDVGYIADSQLTYAESDYLLQSFTGLPAGSSFLVQFDWIVEFYTSNQLFPTEPTPPITPTVEGYRQALARMDACSANSDHIMHIQAFVRSLKDKASDMYQHYHENKEFYDTLLAAGTAILSMVS